MTKLDCKLFRRRITFGLRHRRRRRCCHHTVQPMLSYFRRLDDVSWKACRDIRDQTVVWCISVCSVRSSIEIFGQTFQWMLVSAAQKWHAEHLA